jgi:hypothetical protein
LLSGNQVEMLGLLGIKFDLVTNDYVERK